MFEPSPDRVRQGEGIRAGLSRVGEWEAAPHRTPHLASPWGDRLRANGVSMGLTPLRLVVAQPSTEVGQAGSLRYPVLCFPGVRGLELFLGETRQFLHPAPFSAKRATRTSDRESLPPAKPSD